MTAFKVFLSHSTKDKEFVQDLAQQLKAVGIEPWLCEVDVLLGDDFVEQIERGLREANVTVLIWSPDAAASAWTGKEWRSVLAREVEESRTRLGLLLLRDATIPELLRTKHHIDGRTNPEQSMQDTVNWLVQLRDMRQFEAMGAASFIVDFEPTDFVGRTIYLEQLHRALVDEKGKFLLWGGPGCGKSTLALKFAWRARGAFDTVVFQHCGQRSVEEITDELAKRLGLDLGHLPPEKQAKEIMQWLCQRRTLLVLDDIWNVDIKALIPGPPLSVASLSILCTSRQRSLPWIKRPRTMEVKAFAEDEAESLFRIWLKEEAVSSFRQDLQKLAERVERLPIAVAVAAEMLSRQFGPMGEEARDLEMERLKNEIHDVPSLFQEAINNQGEQERKFLQAMAVCHSEGCWLPFAGGIADLSPTERSQVRDRLIQSSLLQIVDQNRQQFRLHALLREQIRKSLPIIKLSRKKVSILEEKFSNWETLWKECKECFFEIIPALEFLIDEGQKDAMGQLAYQGFVCADRVGERVLALRILETEEHIWATIGGEDAKWNLLQSYGNRALILRSWGKLEEAMALHKKEEALCEELGHKNGLSISYGNQAQILRSWGKLEEAMALHKKEEALCEELGHKDGLQASYSSQAQILADWGQLEQAMALHKKTEVVYEELGHKDSLQRCYGNQAHILRAWGKLDEAMVLLNNQEALCKELGNKSSLGYCYLQWGEIAKELDHFGEAKKKFEAALVLFTELKMPKEQDAVKKELEDLSGEY